MKVSISNSNKPAPFNPAPFLGGLFNLMGSAAAAGISSSSNAAMQKRQIQHDKDMAGLNQRNMLEQMDYANELQIEQWERENAYNDPSEVRARYEQAGISPVAAFGQGSASGAGIAGGLSGAPSGSSTGHSSSLSTPNLSSLNSLGSIGSDIVNGLLASSQKRKTDAEAFGLELENKYKEIKTQTEIQDAIATLELKLEDKKLKQSERDKTVAEIAWLRKQAEKIDSDISVNDQNVQESKKRERKLNAESQKLERINAFEQSIYNTPLEIMNTVPGVATFISKNVRDRVESTVGKLDNEISNSQLFHEFMNFFNGVEGYDPIKKFIKKNWNSIADKLNEIDRKMGFKGKSLPKFD